MECTEETASLTADPDVVPFWFAERVLVSNHTPRKMGLRSPGVAVGSANDSLGRVVNAKSINSRHIGVTMSPEIFFSIERLSLLPAHAPAASVGVYPSTHASR